MLRKRLTRWTSRTEGGDQSLSDLSDSFWSGYVDLLARNAHNKHNDTLPVNTKKYSSTSSAVSNVRSLFTADLPQPSSAQIIALLKLPFSLGGNVARTYFLTRVFQLSTQGFFITNDDVDLCGEKIKLSGAENWENVMCYMDALLFSMFAKLDSFEPVLFLLNQNSNPLAARLSALLRVYVNLLRLGNIITTDISQAICECLAALGFTEATSHKQQDCAPLFEFLTETLAMPLLTFRVEIQHLGKHDDDDRRYSKERILFVSVPDAITEDESQSEEITLEECLEHYFNNSISVKRELQRRATLDSLQYLPLPLGDVTIRSNGSVDYTTSESFSRNLSEQSSKPSPLTPTPEKPDGLPSNARSSQVRIRTRSSTLSVWSINSVENQNKEVMLPAWMLLRLLPFYTDDNDTTVGSASASASASGVVPGPGSELVARNSVEFANRRPVLPICLKRYSFSKGEHKASRSRRRIIIPPVIDLPLFVDNDSSDMENAGQGFKLVLESAVCHRGTSIESGHFVSAVRVSSCLEDETLEQSLASQWYLYDDMKKTRVVTKSFKELFDTEWPYFLFYRLVASNDGRDRGPVSSALSARRSHVSSPVIAPKGAKATFWADDLSERKVNEDAETLELSPKVGLAPKVELSPAIVVETIVNPPEAAKAALSVKGGQSENPVSPISGASKHLGSSETGKSIDHLVDLLPTNPKFVDIRKRYLWYVTDRKKNYYKETASLSKKGSNISILVTPQFRRNSQWSNLSNISGLALESRQCLEKDYSSDKQDPKTEPIVAKGKKKESLEATREVVNKDRKHHIHRIFSHDKDENSKTHHVTKHTEKSQSKCMVM